MTKANTTPGDQYLDKLARLELRVGDLYRAFAGIFNDTAGFWMVLADEEDGHARQLETLRGLSTGDGMAALAREDPFMIDRVLAELDRIIGMVPDARISIEAALSLAYGIEYSMAEKHVISRPRLDNETVRQVFEQLELADEAHLQRLREMALNRGLFVPEAR